MKRMLYACIALILAFNTIHAFAATDVTDVTGVWSGEMKGDNGSFELTFTFKQEGASLTGSVQGPGGDPLIITDGKIDGDKISFKVTYNGTVFTDEGTVTGDEIKLRTKADPGEFTGDGITLKRTAPAKAAPPANPPSAIRQYAVPEVSNVV